MEDWQLDQACYTAGRCFKSVEDELIELEEAYETGEITAHEAEILHHDLTHTKERKMKTAYNLITKILDDRKTEAEKKLIYKATINALTSAVATNIIQHLANMRRPELTGMDDPQTGTEAGTIASLHGEPTLDSRNAIDLAKDADEMGTEITKEMGYDTSTPPLRIAEICDGIRNTLYEEFEGIVDLAPPQALYRNPPPQGRPNYDQPMSLEFNLAFRIQMAGRVDETRVQRAAKEDNEDADFIRDVMRKDNERLAKSLSAVAPEVVKEAESFNSDFTSDAFETLPLDAQIRIGTKIAQTINNEYVRLYGIKLRSGSLEVASQAVAVKENWIEVKEWVNQATKLLEQRGRTTL